jgi:predicted glycosyltransferase
MARCSGIIGNAGFELASEALHMGCPLLVKPLKGQVEQLSNVMNLKLLGLADSIDEVLVEAVALWLGNKKPVQVHYPDVARELASWIANQSTATVHDLANRVWSQVSGRTIMSPVLDRSTQQHIPV